MCFDLDSCIEQGVGLHGLTGPFQLHYSMSLECPTTGSQAGPMFFLKQLKIFSSDRLFLSDWQPEKLAVKPTVQGIPMGGGEFTKN